MEQGKKKFAWNKLLPLVHLWPGLLVLVLVAATLPMTNPVLQEVPARLEASALEPLDEGEQEEEIEEVFLELVDANYTDGVYTGSAQGYGGTITVQVTVENGQIADIEILSAPGETDSFFNRAKGVIDLVLARQTWEVDVISGATYSSRGILGAIQNALTGEQVVNEAPEPVAAVAPLTSERFEEPEGYADGTYYGSASGFGGTIQVEVVISGGQISSIRVVSAPGETGSYLSRAEVVIQRMLEANSPNVDVVSGATYSSNGIINATKRALNQAVSSGQTVQEVPEEPSVVEPQQPDAPVIVDPERKPAETYLDGVYTGTGMGFGGDIEVQVAVQNGRIGGIRILWAEGETPAYLTRAEGVISAMLSGQTTEVDVVSGATYSSEGIIGAVKAALEKALVQPDAPGVPAEPDTPVPPEVQPAETYLDGVYTDVAEGYDGEIEVEVTVEKGRIGGIRILRAEGETPAYLIRAEGVISAILSGQTTEVDVVSGATYSSEGIIGAVKAALEKALVQPDDPDTPVEPEVPVEPEIPVEPEQPEAPVYQDGVYTASALCSDGDWFTYTVRVTVTVAEGKITGVQADRVDDVSEYPEDNEAYFDNAVNGRTVRGIWYEGVVPQILAAQSADAVDAVSRATYSSSAIQSAAKAALAEARAAADQEEGTGG